MKNKLPGHFLILVLVYYLLPVQGQQISGFTLKEKTIFIRQIDYESAVYYNENDPYPHLDRNKIRKDVIINKDHKAVIMENGYIRLTLLPEMGRVYSFVYKATGHDVFWKNDIVTAGAGQHNDCGWWIWIGGAEYTLPGDEHGTTWAEKWRYEIIENSDVKKSVRMSVIEKGTGLTEDIDISIYPDRSYYETRISIANPTDKTVMFAHWINPQWVPGGENELTDNTEFIIPTDQILIPDRFQKNLGESPQNWETSRLRFIKGWDKGWGDLMADGLEYGFYSAYSHDKEEGVVRVFDEDINPGCDIWTYGYHTDRIPMGSGAKNKGYAEMWGGTSKTYPDERHPIKPGEVIEWTEWMYPYHNTGGLTFADKNMAVNLTGDAKSSKTILGLYSTGQFKNVECSVYSGDNLLFNGTINITPDKPFKQTIINLLPADKLIVELRLKGKILTEYKTENFR